MGTPGGTAQPSHGDCLTQQDLHGDDVGDGGYRLARKTPDSDRRGEGNGRDAPALCTAAVQEVGFGARVNQGLTGVDGILISDSGREKRINAHQDSLVI